MQTTDRKANSEVPLFTLLLLLLSFFHSAQSSHFKITESSDVIILTLSQNNNLNNNVNYFNNNNNNNNNNNHNSEFKFESMVCMSPADLPADTSNYFAYLTLTFSSLPSSFLLSFPPQSPLSYSNPSASKNNLLDDENSFIYFTKGDNNVNEKEDEISNDFVIILHAADENLNGYNDQFTHESGYLLISVISEFPLLSSSLTFQSPSYITSDLAPSCPFYYFRGSDNNNGANTVVNNNDNDQVITGVHSELSSTHSTQNEYENGLVLLLCSVFALVLMISCFFVVVSSLVILFSSQNQFSDEEVIVEVEKSPRKLKPFEEVNSLLV